MRTGLAEIAAHHRRSKLGRWTGPLSPHRRYSRLFSHAGPFLPVAQIPPLKSKVCALTAELPIEAHHRTNQRLRNPLHALRSDADFVRNMCDRF